MQFINLKQRSPYLTLTTLFSMFSIWKNTRSQGFRNIFAFKCVSVLYLGLMFSNFTCRSKENKNKQHLIVQGPRKCWILQTQRLAFVYTDVHLPGLWLGATFPPNTVRMSSLTTLSPGQCLRKQVRASSTSQPILVLGEFSSKEENRVLCSTVDWWI